LFFESKNGTRGMTEQSGFDKKDLDLYFEFKCRGGLKKRGLDSEPEYVKRLEYEMDVIKSMGFSSYFLVVQDFVLWAKRNDIPRGPARGSVAGSLIAYVLEITTVDPIKYDLFFERFQNPHRISPPDIDLDFPKGQRESVVKYLTQKYGKDCVAQVGTIGTMKAKQAIQKVCSALGYSIQTGEELRKLVLAPVHGKPQSLDACYQKVKELKNYRINPGPQKEILEWAEKFEGRIASAGVHASGLLISNEPIYEKTPLYRTKGDGGAATQWDKNEVEEIGLIKFDLLGLLVLDKIGLCLDLIKERHEKTIDIENLDTEDKETFKMIQQGHLLGCFQLEGSQGLRDLTVRAKPTSISELSDVIALFRPGPLESGLVDEYVACKSGEKEPTYFHPDAKPILSNTCGIVVYQEQVMQLSRAFGGFSMAEADTLRKAIGKKDDKLLQAQKERFKKGWLKRGLSPAGFEEFWERLHGFSSYSFNKSHSLGYALLAFQTAYLKTHYPVEFMAACMTKDAGDVNQMIKYLGECQRLGIKVLPPDINESKDRFVITKSGSIRFGLIPIRNIGEGPTKEILDKRFKQGPFSGIRDFCARVHLSRVNKLKIESLIKAGAFDSFGHTRASLLVYAEKRWDWMKEQKSFESKLKTYNKKMKAYEERLEKVVNGEYRTRVDKNGKEQKVKLTPLKKPVRPLAPRVPTVPDIPEVEKQVLLEEEHFHLNFFLSGHPLEGISIENSYEIDDISLLSDLPSGSDANILAILSVMKEHTTSRKKQQMAFARLEDTTGSIEAVIFPSVFKKCNKFLTPLTPLLFSGKTEVIEIDGEKNIAKFIVRHVAPVKIIHKKKKDKKDDIPLLSLPIEKIPVLLSAISGMKNKKKFHLKIALKSDVTLDFKKPIYLPDPLPSGLLGCIGV